MKRQSFCSLFLLAGLFISTLRIAPPPSPYGHTTLMQLDGQLVGPFPPNTLVSLRTRVSNSHAGFVLGDIVQGLIPA